MKRRTKPQKAEKQYFRFTEENDWEGETWHFYIPVKGNEDAVAGLKEDLSRFADFDKADQYGGLPYQIDDKTFGLEDINALRDAEDEDYGYMSKHNKLTGYLKSPRLSKILDVNTAEQWYGSFYKGGIQQLMERRAVKETK